MKFVNNAMMRCKSLLDLIDIVSDNSGKNEYKRYKITLEYTKMLISLIYGYLNCQKYQTFNINKILLLFIEFFIEN